MFSQRQKKQQLNYNTEKCSNIVWAFVDLFNASIWRQFVLVKGMYCVNKKQTSTDSLWQSWDDLWWVLLPQIWVVLLLGDKLVFINKSNLPITKM